MEIFLHETHGQPRGVAPCQSAQRDERRPPKKHLPQRSVAHAERLQQADHPRTFQHEDQQRRSHVEKRHHEHDADNHRGIHVMGLQPVENIGIKLRHATHGEVRRIVGIVVEQGPSEPAGEIVGSGQVRGENLVARYLAVRPVRQPLHVAQVGHDHRVVHFVHSRRVDSRHLETVAPGPVSGLDEEHFDLVAHAEHQFLGHAARQQYIFRTHRIAHTGQLALHQPLAERRPVVIPVHALEHHPLHGIRRTDDTALDGIGGQRHESFGGADQLLGAGTAAHGVRIERPHAPHAVHHGMSRKGGHLAGHLLLETHDHGHRQQHHRDAQRHGNHGDTLHHTGFVLRGALRRPAGDEKGEIHGCLICWKIYAK